MHLVHSLRQLSCDKKETCSESLISRSLILTDLPPRVSVHSDACHLDSPTLPAHLCGSGGHVLTKVIKLCAPFPSPVSFLLSTCRCTLGMLWLLTSCVSGQKCWYERCVLPLLCNLGASQCPGSSTHGGCHQRQTLHSPLAQGASAGVGGAKSLVMPPGIMREPAGPRMSSPPMFHNICSMKTAGERPSLQTTSKPGIASGRSHAPVVC